MNPLLLAFLDEACNIVSGYPHTKPTERMVNLEIKDLARSSGSTWDLANCRVRPAFRQYLAPVHGRATYGLSGIFYGPDSIRITPRNSAKGGQIHLHDRSPASIRDTVTLPRNPPLGSGANDHHYHRHPAHKCDLQFLSGKTCFWGGHHRAGLGAWWGYHREVWRALRVERFCLECPGNHTEWHSL